MPHRSLLAAFVLFLPLSISAMDSASSQPAPVQAPDCTANVALGGDDGLKVDVVYRCRASSPVTFNAASEMAAGEVMSFTDATGKPVQRAATSWSVEPVNGLAEAHYTVDLLAYAKDMNSPTQAIARGNGVLTLLEGWLLEPRGLPHLPVIDIHVQSAPGLSFASGLPKVGDAWRLQGTPVRFAGYSALGKFTLKEIVVPAPGSLRAGQPKEEGVLRLAMLDGFSGQGLADLTDWVHRTAEAEANYWRGFTAKQLMLGLVPMDGRRGVGFGRTVPGGGATIMVEVGSDVEKRRLFGEWVLVHELIHSGMPYINGQGTWLMEGAATYVEPIIRARAGWKTEAEAWKEWINNMPRGVGVFNSGLASAMGQQNYWGGATFMLLADLGIRRATRGAKGLEDCLGGVLWSGIDATQRLTVAQFAQACDRASDSDVVSTLVARHFRKADPVDLSALWKEIGVAEVGGQIVFDDTAPQAEWRKMIVMGPPNRPPHPVKLPWQS
jgi:hypothetical protein